MYYAQSPNRINLLGKWRQSGSKLEKLRGSLAHRVRLMGLADEDQVSLLQDVVKLVELCWLHFGPKKSLKRKSK